MCLPCAKEIINQSAKAKVRQLREFRLRLNRYIQHKRLEPKAAEEFLRRSIACEANFVIEADAALGHLIENLKEPWAEGVSLDAMDFTT